MTAWKDRLFKTKPMENFYCQQKCGDVNFNIDEWKEQMDLVDKLGITLDPLKPCDHQCEDCINIVLETQLKNKDPEDVLERLKKL
jgi:hypothetical protein